MKTLYCRECPWRVNTADGFTSIGASLLAIDHFVETHHTIDSVGFGDADIETVPDTL